MPNALYPEMKPTPRNRLLGVLADALTAGRDTAALKASLSEGE